MDERDPHQRVGTNDIDDHFFLSERHWDDYASKLDLVEKDLQKWHVILDLGSGCFQEFADDIEKLGFKDVKVLSIDPTLGIKSPSGAMRRTIARPNTAIAFAEELPLLDDSVDVIFALFSIPFYSMNDRDELLAAKEMIRVLKPGGEIRIFPYNYSKRPLFLDEIETYPNDEIQSEFFVKNKPNPLDGLLIIRKLKK